MRASGWIDKYTKEKKTEEKIKKKIWRAEVTKLIVKKGEVRPQSTSFLNGEHYFLKAEDSELVIIGNSHFSKGLERVRQKFYLHSEACL